MRPTLIVLSLALLFLFVVGCGPSAVQISLDRSLKAATSRSVNCPAQKILVWDHQPEYKAWVARGCKRTYTCVGVNLEQEFAECKETNASRKARGVKTTAWGLGGTPDL